MCILNKSLEILEKVLRYEMFEGGGFIPMFMKITIEPIKELIEQGHTLDPNFFEEFSLPVGPIEWYVAENGVIKARSMEV